jgi:hypothetical protein
MAPLRRRPLLLGEAAAVLVLVLHNLRPSLILLCCVLYCVCVCVCKHLRNGWGCRKVFMGAWMLPASVGRPIRVPLFASICRNKVPRWYINDSDTCTCAFLPSANWKIRAYMLRYLW